MGIWDENRIAFFIAFVVPGFIAIKAYELVSPSTYIESSKQIVDAVAYSCLNYALLLWPIYYVETSQWWAAHRGFYMAFYLFVLFVFPVCIVVGWKFLRELEFIQKHVPHPTQKPWDYVFGQRRTCWVVVTLKSGAKIAGMYGPNSFASSAPAEEQIYLEEEWILNDDGGFERRAEQTMGIIILSSEIMTIELFNSGEATDG